MSDLVYFKGWECKVRKQRYSFNNQIALVLIATENNEDCFASEVIAKATVCIAEIKFAESETVIKEYSENEGMTQSLVNAGWVERTGGIANFGMVYGPIVRVLK